MAGEIVVLVQKLIGVSTLNIVRRLVNDLQTIGLTLRAKGKEGESLPAVFHQLERIGAKIRRGQVTLVAGAAGAGKALGLAL